MMIVRLMLLFVFWGFISFHFMNICTYNCQSVNANIEFIKMLTATSDIICLQETLLNDNNHSVLATIDGSFDYCHTPATRNPEVSVGRSSGGLAFLWRKSKQFAFYPVYFSDRIMGLNIKYPKHEYLIINVYA